MVYLVYRGSVGSVDFEFVIDGVSSVSMVFCL